MSFWPVPDIMKENIYELTPRMFTNRGIKFILLDVDNTLAPYTVSGASQRLVKWAEGLKAAGLELFILSNNKGSRPEVFAKALDVDYVNRAWKPFTKTAKQVMAQRGYTPQETAFLGDQIYTDTACARWTGAFAVLVHPIQFSNIWLRLRYWLEWPFRLKYQWKYMK